MNINNLIIDGTNIDFRVFYVTRKEKNLNSQNENIEILNKFLPVFKNLIERFNPTNIYATWDKRLTHPSTNFRKEILQGTYKSNRNKPDDVQSLYDQEAKIIEILSSLGVKHILPNVLEADDVISWLTTKLTGSTVVVSVDNDLYQLVNDNVNIWNLTKLITKDNFKEVVGIDLNYFKLFKAIKGDQADNIDGIPGFGNVRATNLAYKYTKSNITEEYKQIIERNLKLIDLDYGYKNQPGELDSYEEQFKNLNNTNYSFKHFKILCEKYELVNILNNIEYWKRFYKRNNLVDMINGLLH